MNNKQTFDASIPVLTEVFQDEAVNNAVPAAAEPPAAATAGAAPDASIEALASATLSEPQWAALEHRLTERILQQLQDRGDAVLEQRVRDSMEAALDRAIAGLTAEIRAGLQGTLENIVVTAVGQQLAHLQTLKK